MFDDLVNKEKEKIAGIECPICHEFKVKEHESTAHDGFEYRNFECGACKSHFSIRSIGI
jgi:transposase-like protein